MGVRHRYRHRTIAALGVVTALAVAGCSSNGGETATRDSALAPATGDATPDPLGQFDPADPAESGSVPPKTTPPGTAPTADADGRPVVTPVLELCAQFLPFAYVYEILGSERPVGAVWWGNEIGTSPEAYIDEYGCHYGYEFVRSEVAGDGTNVWFMPNRETIADLEESSGPDGIVARDDLPARAVQHRSAGMVRCESASPDLTFDLWVKDAVGEVDLARTDLLANAVCGRPWTLS